jgi:hypothetical protein
MCYRLMEHISVDLGQLSTGSPLQDGKPRKLRQRHGRFRQLVCMLSRKTDPVDQARGGGREVEVRG